MIVTTRRVSGLVDLIEVTIDGRYAGLIELRDDGRYDVHRYGRPVATDVSTLPEAIEALRERAGT